jgi:carboxymethylenebutenolidase
MIERTEQVPTKDGACTTFIVHPERDGPHPVVLFFMDAPGIREELRDMARRLASVGYYVMLPNLYHRADVLEVADLGLSPEERMPRVMGLMGSLTIGLVMEDADAMLAFASHDAAASAGLIGVVGYCMSGQYAINLAARYPKRVGAAASFYGTQLVTDRTDSPHLVGPQAGGELYVGYAETDHWAPPEMVESLAQAWTSHGVNAEVELYRGVDHGFAFPGRAAYDRDAAERHWERLFALFARTLT